ncbi:MAG: ABC transporter substrate-binding protein, partial [Deinococcota bacterium]
LGFTFAQDTQVGDYTISEVVDGMRTVEHLAGTTEIPADPQRVMTLHDIGLTTMALHLGFQPFASQGRLVDGKEYFYLGKGFNSEGLELAGTYPDFDLERILGLEPDLIIGRVWEEDIYDELSAIAPTVLVPVDIMSDDILFSEYMANILNRMDRHEAFVREYESIIDRIQRLVPNPEEITVTSVVIQDAEPTIMIFGGVLPIDKVIRDVGFSKREAIVDMETQFAAENMTDRFRLSIEALPEIDADFIFNNYYLAPDGNYDSLAITEDFMSGPFWNSLFAVQNNQYIQVESNQTYGDGMFYLLNAANMVLTHVAERGFVTNEEGWD